MPDRPQRLTLAVLSDLHVFEGSVGGSVPSYFTIPNQQGAAHPYNSLVDLIDKDKLTADIVVCAGDLGDKAHPSAISEAWRALHKLRGRLKANDLFITSGNHDVDSRYQYNEYDAKGVLQELDPPYPFADESLNDRYWSRHFVICDHPHARFLVLNSAGYHGVQGTPQTGKPKQPLVMEYEHGRIASRTVNAVRKELVKQGARDTNILLCHHHPAARTESDKPDRECMRNGDSLLALLAQSGLGPWIVIHGHRHRPEVYYAAGGGSAPLIFSVGSFAALPYPQLSPGMGNQFYFLEIDYSASKRLGLAGAIRAWDWMPGQGWKPAQTTSGLPSSSGFGFRGNPQGVAANLAAMLSGRDLLKWDEVLKAHQDLAFMSYGDLVVLREILNNQFKCGLLIDQEGIPREVGKK